MLTVVLMLAVWLWVGHSQQVKINRFKNEPYSLAFTNIGAKLLESRMDCWARLNTPTSSEELKEVLQELAGSLELSSPEVNVNVNDSTTLVRLIADTEQSEYFFTGQSDDKQTYVLVSIVSSECRDFARERRAINQVIPVKTAYLYTGAVSGLRGQKEKTGLVNSLLAEFDTRQIEVYDNQKVVSASGISPLFRETVECGANRYNLQAAARYHQGEDLTYIYLGFPLILGEY